MNVLITGGYGFIGSHLAERLSKKYNVVIYDISDRNRQYMDESHVSKITYVCGNILDKYLLRETLEKYTIDIVVHLASVSRVCWGERDPLKCSEINVHGTISLIDAILDVKKIPVILGSSREVYGEPALLPVKEDHGKMPVNVYGMTKFLAEKIVMQYTSKYRVPCIILRFSNVYGSERDILDRVIPKFILSAMKNKTLELYGKGNLFDFTYIEDTVEGIVLAINRLYDMSNLCEDFHLLTGKPTSLEQLVHIISNVLGKKIRYVITEPRSYDVKRFYGDPSKAKELLGFQAKVNIREGIRRTVYRLKKYINCNKFDNGECS